MYFIYLKHKLKRGIRKIQRVFLRVLSCVGWVHVVEVRRLVKLRGAVLFGIRLSVKVELNMKFESFGNRL